MSEPSPVHLDLDALADALAGLPDGTGHLAGCPSCTSRLSELAAADSRVTAALAGLPTPELPDDVAQRLSAALAAEPPLSPAPGTRAASVTALPGRTAPRRWVPAAAAAAVLMVSAAGLGLAFLPERAGEESASVAAGGGAGLPTSETGVDYADEAAVAQVLPGVLGGTATALDSSDGFSTRSEAQGEDAGDAGATAQTEQQDPALTAQEPAPAAAGADALARLRTTEGLADCLAALLPPDEPDVQPLALDYAQFRGEPALAVVLPDPDPGTLAVYVVGAGCTAQDESLLTFLRVDAP